MALPDRSEAMLLLREHTENENLVKHMLAVEACMRSHAHRCEEPENLWGITGLLHDFDYEKHPTPEEHPMFGVRILEERGYPDEMIHAIKAHATYLGVLRDSLLDKCLFAVDELTGFIVAVTLMRPSGMLADLKVSSVRKKMKQSGFARNVSREDMQRGADELGMSLEEHISFVIDAMKGISEDLGL
jgi:putative nucleotidyltransferase with HDIG domain